MCVICKKVDFILSRGTPREHRVSLLVTMVDNTAWCALLGMEFIANVGGCYATYTEMFRYRRVGPDGHTQSFEISAPCHLSSSPLIAYAFFSGLMTNKAKLMDVQGAHDDNVLVEEFLGYHSAPHQLAPIQLLQLTQACKQDEKAQLVK